MELLDFRLAGVSFGLQNAPKPNTPMKFGMRRKCETNPQKNGNQITSLYTVDFQITQEQDGKDTVCVALQLRYLVWLESSDPITEQGRFEGEFITDQLKPVVYEAVNRYLAAAKLPAINFKAMNMPQTPTGPDMTGAQV